MPRWMRPSMASELLFDTSGFFALIDERDTAHERAVTLVGTQKGRARPVTTEWIIGETCTLLIARRRHHLVSPFLDRLDKSAALMVANPDAQLLNLAKQ